MSTLRILIAALSVGLCGILLFGVAHFAGIEQATPGTATPPEEIGAGHDQKWVRLPFGPCALEDLPAARTPDGKPLTLERIAGHYSWTTGFTGSSIRIDASGACESHWGACLASGSSQGVARIVKGRIEIEALSKNGKRTGLKCVCVPVWWEGVIYLLGPSEGGLGSSPADFCNSVNWGELNDSDGRLSRFELLYSSGSLPGRPAESGVPEEIARGILRAPLEGEVVEVTPEGSRVNLGKRNGVYAGQRLRLASPGNDGRNVRVLEVTETTCVVGGPPFSHPTPPPALGTVVRSEAKGAAGLGVR